MNYRNETGLKGHFNPKSKIPIFFPTNQSSHLSIRIVLVRVAQFSIYHTTGTIVQKEKHKVHE